MPMPTFKLDGKTIPFEPGDTIIRAAWRQGIEIPHYCWHPGLSAPAKSLTTRDMFVPTCATCHMSGINGLKVTHDPSDRLSYYLADATTKPRPNKEHAQAAMPGHGEGPEGVAAELNGIAVQHDGCLRAYS